MSIITPYTGDINNIPSGWRLCDGTNGTPNLEGLFIRGVANNTRNKVDAKLSHSHAVGYGGVHSHSTYYDGRHVHYSETTYGAPGYYGNSSGYEKTDDGAHTHSIGSAGSHYHLMSQDLAKNPPYYVLAYIMSDKNIMDYDFPRGIIVGWNGTIEEIPDGWHLCNGENGTPNLINRFIMGTKDNIGETGDGTHVHSISSSGSHSHSNTSSTFIGQHGHYYTGPYGGHLKGYTDSVGQCQEWKYGSSHSHAHGLYSSGSHSHDIGVSDEIYPAYYSLAFIQKIV